MLEIYTKIVGKANITFDEVMSCSTMLTPKDKHNLCSHRVARLQVRQAWGVDLGESGFII